jgi:predicted amidohydrolase YtcJ
MSSNKRADILIRANSIHTCEDGLPVQHALAIAGEYIFAVSDEPHGLDDFLDSNTKVIDLPNSTVLPTFDDTHTHLIFAGLSEFDVPVHTAKDLKGMLELIRQRASETEPGEWICTTANWQEFNLPEKRFPTLQELDEISTAHPILVRRGGHNVVANSLAMQHAQVTVDTQPPPGGKIGKDEQGRLNGLIQDSAVMLIDRVKPSMSVEKRITGLERASASYAATGIGCVRDCFVPFDDIAILKATHDAGKLNIRVRALVSTIGMSEASDVDHLLSSMEEWRSLQNDPWLSIWGLKFMLDGGIEAGATEEPYVSGGCECGSHAGFRGRLLWDPDKMVEAVDMAVSRGWNVGTHAYGDRAIRVLLDVYERVLQRHPDLPVGTLVMEHGGLATPELRERAVALGVAVTVQHPLLHDAAGIQEIYWGLDRVSRIFPYREWLDLGAIVTGGSDYPVGAYGAMHSVWGMSSRQTVVGVRGPQHAITVPEAISLHTSLATKMLREAHLRGALTPGRYADLTILLVDPYDSDILKLRDARPLCTIIGGKIRYLQE